MSTSSQALATQRALLTFTVYVWEEICFAEEMQSKFWRFTSWNSVS